MEFLNLGKRNRRGINILAFRPFVFAVRQELLKYPKVDCKIYHDVQLHYKDTFEDFMKLISTGKQQIAPIDYGEKFVALGENGLSSIDFIASEEEPLIRLADYFCSFYQRSLTDIDKGYISSDEYDRLIISFWGQIYRLMYPHLNFPKWYYEGFSTPMHVKIFKVVQGLQNIKK